MIAFAERSPGGRESSAASSIKAVNADTGEVRTLVSPNGQATFGGPNQPDALAYTPDGQLIAAAYGMRDKKMQTTLWEICPDGSSRVYLSEHQVRKLGAAIQGGTVQPLAFARHAPRMLLGEARAHSTWDLWLVDLPDNLVHPE